MENSDLFVQIGNVSTDAYFIADTINNRIEYVNDAFEAIWEIPAAEIKNSPAALLNTVHPEDQEHIKDYFLDLLEDGSGHKIEFRIICPGGKEKYVRLSTYTIKQEGKITGLAGIAENISVIRRNIFYMEKINARKNSMLEILAHDLKGPIGTINMLASGITREPEIAENEHLMGSIKYIQDICKRNIALIRDLTNSEYLESTEVELRKERADIVWEIQDVIHIYRKSEKLIAKTFNITSSSDKIFIHFDSLKFIQAINNIISNAIKFTPDNGIISVDIQEKSETLQITIADNGVGIPQDLQPFLFDKFTKARRVGLRGEEPVGLGMSIIKTIVELHGGKIWFKSKENEGSVFYIEIPKE